MNPFIISFKNKISDILSRDVQIKEPPEHIEADLTIIASSPDQSNQEAEKIRNQNFEFISDIDSQGPFINLEFASQAFYQKTLSEVLENKENFGNSEKYKDKNAFIEYSSPNIAKPMGVGHLRSTIIGESLSRIYESVGFNTHQVNFLGDWGTQFGQWYVSYQKWGDEQKIEENPLQELKELYVKFQEEAQQNESLNEEARQAFKKLEEGDEEMKEFWNKFREWSIKGFKRVYDRLGIEFDEYSGESFVADQAREEVQECLQAGICSKNKDGSIAAEFEDLPSTVLQKKDGSTLYLTRDLAALKKRIEEHQPDRILYVVDARQSLHFQQLFELAESLDYLKEVEPVHIKFGLLMIENEPMSTREGTLIELEDLLDKSVEKAAEIIKNKNPKLSEQERQKAARKVGLGAIIYNDLKQHRTKEVHFDWEKVLNFKEGSGPYLQYSYARIKSILRKSKVKFENFENFEFKDEIEFKLAKKILLFPEIIERSAENDSPHFIANFLEDLASVFNKFYSEVPVLEAENDKLKKSRLALIKSTSLTLKKGLYLLGVEVPEQM